MNLIQSLVITGVMIGREGVRRIWPVRTASNRLRQGYGGPPKL